MPTFVDTDQGLVNLDRVALVSRRRSSRSNGILRYEFLDPEGNVLGSIESAYIDFASLTAPLVPAAAGMTAYIVSVDASSGARPTEADLFVFQSPVIAWRVSPHWIEPILAEATGDGAHVLVINEDGSLIEPEIQLHDNIETAKAEILRQAQEAFDQRARAA